MKGISVIICCHNSAPRIGQTLEHLKASEDPSCPWEVLLIDNNCTDATTTIAQKTWGSDFKIKLRIIKEPVSGLSHARRQGLKEAKYPIIALIDDDNLVPHTWIKAVKEFMLEHPNCAACGGPIFPKCETPAPTWFRHFQGNYSIYDYYKTTKRIKHPLVGAGLVLRKDTLEALYNSGFRSILSDRKGGILSSGGDYEICYSLLLMQKELWYSPLLAIEHFIPKERLNWRYLKRLNRGFGEQAPILEIYERLLKAPYNKYSWKKEVAHGTLTVAKLAIKTLKDSISGKLEGSANQLLLINQAFRLISLLRTRQEYDRQFIALGKAPWNKSNLLKSNASS